MPNSANKSFLSPQLLFLLAIVAGTLGWEVVASLLGLLGLEINLTTGPVGFDARVLSIYMRVNPGTFLGLFLGYRAARAVSSGTAGRSRRGASSGARRSRGSSGASSKSGSTAGSGAGTAKGSASKTPGRRGSSANGE